MLTLDSNQVSRISLQRFARVVEDELAKSKSETAPSNSLAWGNIGTTLTHNLTSTGEDNENTRILSKLRSQVTDVDRVRQSSQHAIEAKTAEKPAMGHETEEAATTKAATKAATKVSKKERQVTDTTEDSSAADTASGERIQHLLQDQKDLSAKDLEVEQRTQAMLVNELTELTSMLKDSTIGINRAVKLQNIQLASMGVHAAENRDELEKQKQRMKESTQGMTSSLWGTVWTMLWVVAVFSATYAVIRLLPNRKVYPTCANPNSIDTRLVEAYRAAAGVEHALNAVDIVAQDAMPELVSPSASSDSVAEQTFDASVLEGLVEGNPQPSQEQWEVLPDGEPVAQEPHQLQEDEIGQEEAAKLEEELVHTEHDHQMQNKQNEPQSQPQLQEVKGVVDDHSVHANFDPTEGEGEGAFTEVIAQGVGDGDRSVHEDAEEIADEQEGLEHEHGEHSSAGTTQFGSHEEEVDAFIEEETEREEGAGHQHGTLDDTLRDFTESAESAENSLSTQVEEDFSLEQPVYKEELHHEHDNQVAEEDTAQQQQQQHGQEGQQQEGLEDDLGNNLEQVVEPVESAHEGLGPIYDKPDDQSEAEGQAEGETKEWSEEEAHRRRQYEESEQGQQAVEDVNGVVSEEVELPVEFDYDFDARAQENVLGNSGHELHSDFLHNDEL